MLFLARIAERLVQPFNSLHCSGYSLLRHVMNKAHGVAGVNAYIARQGLGGRTSSPDSG